MKYIFRIKWLASVVVVMTGSNALAESGLSEKDYFSDLPEVLTVTRLAQPLSETPGAVTIIDRETIRRSGARELADVLRLVPGYIVGGFNGANPVAAYHAPIDSLGARNLVLVDGRSIYSGYYQSGTQLSMMGILLEDIDRIEVLRGSNSAAYGANAMFGVINIITQHASDLLGAELAVSSGEGGVKDSMARIGWGNDAARFRLSTGRRMDHGYYNSYDDKVVRQLHLRGDLKPALDQEIMLSAGVVEISGGDGFPLGSDNNTIGGNPLRTAGWHDFYVQGQWRRQLSASDEIKLSANFDEESFADDFPFALDPTVTLGLTGRGRRANLEFQHQLGIASSLRAVWGAGYKYEDVKSRLLYAKDEPISLHEERLFGNLEWRPHEMWLINAGGFWGNHSWKGSYFSPRLMANLLLTPDHALRAGVSESTRMPSLFEMAADVRYVFSPAAPFPYGLFSTQSNPYYLYRARNNIGPEKLFTEEIGYFGNFRDWRMTVDVRGYIERMEDVVKGTSYAIPLNNPKAKDFINNKGFETHGLEYQVRWKPWKYSEVWFNQGFQRLQWETAGNNGKNQPPMRSTTLAIFQKLPLNLDFSVMFHHMTSMSWGNFEESLPERRRLDARLAWPFRVGSTKAEAAFTVQSATGSYPEYFQRYGLQVERRAFGTLRLSF